MADIGAILVGQRTQRQAATEPVQAFAVRQHTVGQHAGVNAVAVQRFHLQRHQPVIEQQGVAGADIVDQAQITDPDMALIAGSDAVATDRSEERSVGKECVGTVRCRWSQYHEKKKNTKIKNDRQQQYMKQETQKKK